MDLVKRLRQRAYVHYALERDGEQAEPWPRLFDEAADRIEVLEAAMRQIADTHDNQWIAGRIARAALEGK